MLENYFPVLMFILVGLAIGVVPMLAGWLLAPNRPDAKKLSPYECGFEAFEDAHEVRRALLPGGHPVHPVRPGDRLPLPWAVVLEEIGLFGFVAMVIFLGILVVGFVYEWMKGAWTGNKAEHL